MIREAEISDLPYFIKAAQEFIEETPFNLDPESYLNQVIDLIQSDNAAIFTTGKGHCAVVLVPSLYDENQIIAKIVSTWGKGGLKCFKVASEWASANGATVLMADSYIEPRMEKFYLRTGMTPADIVYMKVI